MRASKQTNPKFNSMLDRVSDECTVCVGSSRPQPSAKLSLTHVNEEFNNEVQVDFVFIQIKDTKYTCLYLVDTGTAFSECVITSSRKTDTIITTLNQEWILKHGAPAKLSADEEFSSGILTTFLSTHKICFKARPARRHNKVGIVERKNGTIKMIMERLQRDHFKASPRELIAKMTFLSNICSGSKLVSSFELVHG